MILKEGRMLAVGYLILVLGVVEGFFTAALISEFKKNKLPFREDFYLGNKPIYSAYDYIIIGASPSGCALANRLSADPQNMVLLLEAGSEPNFYSDVPIFNLYMYETDFNWKFHSQYNPNVCRALEDATCPWPSGKGIGGGTIFNAMMYTRGNRWEYDNWSKEGNTGWSYDELEKYWKRVEKVQAKGLTPGPGRGTNGSVTIEFPPHRSLGSKVFLEAGKELGLPLDDYNAPYGETVGYIQLALRRGVRNNAGSAYLAPVASRPNLHIVQKALVSRVIINPEMMTATGVEFLKKGRLRSVDVRKEVVVAAGAFGSPKVLMLSGVGPRAHLESLEIPVLVDLPVGDNLMEHIGTNHPTFMTNTSGFNLDIKNAFLTLPAKMLEYITKGTGLLTTPGVETIAYMKTKYAENDVPDVELLYAGSAFSDDFGQSIRKTVGIRDEVYDAYWKPLEGKNVFGIYLMACYPRSKGTVRLASRHPIDPPVITNNFLSDERDLDVIVEGIKKILEFTRTDAMKRYSVEEYRKQLPGCEEYEYGTDEYWACTIRQITTQWHHQSGTCKMGPDGDPTSVVDPRLRVRGVNRLRVADMSIAPTIPAGHTMSAAYMIGEKAADLVLEDNAAMC